MRCCGREGGGRRRPGGVRGPAPPRPSRYPCTSPVEAWNGRDSPAEERRDGELSWMHESRVRVLDADELASMFTKSESKAEKSEKKRETTCRCKPKET